MVNAAYYCLAAFPPHDIRDAKWMAIQDRFEKYQSPHELYQALPLSVPLKQADFIQHVKGETYKFDTGLMESVPKLEWSQLYNIKPLEGKRRRGRGQSVISGCSRPSRSKTTRSSTSEGPRVEGNE